ncbi:MAG: hypothetical protein CVV11_05305 [Gammaproteobacteria bacterium HGW-Gammaproteobacteria-15]|nr:MAG: hypothetical protein CVV11_05305 [Gammaproteobacteria bacterium HGW-Gammaproteobacteria-15]
MVAAFIPVVFQNARVLAAAVYPNHLVQLSSWGFTALPPTCMSKSIGYATLRADFSAGIHSVDSPPSL